MRRQEKEVYEFGPFRIDVGERRLIQKGHNVSSLRNIPVRQNLKSCADWTVYATSELNGGSISGSAVEPHRLRIGRRTATSKGCSGDGVQ